jgi:peptidoglycan/xylan/chitin deacetylase (PgdA/CDA1 family)
VSASTCMVVMYHYVRDSAATPFPTIRALPPAIFEQQLDWLEREYRLVALDDLEAALDGRSPLPPNAALLTFDDGFVDHYAAVLPILRTRGLRGVFFLAHEACGPSPRVLGVHKTHVLLARLGADAFAKFVLEECEPALATPDGARRARVFGADRWEHGGERAVKDLLNYELPFEEAARVLDALFDRHVGPQDAFARDLYLQQPMIAEMAGAGMTFGYHTRSHRMLSRLTSNEQEGELRDGVAWIRAVTGQARVPFCYPWGGPKTYTSDTLRILARTGYSVAFNTVRRRIEIGRDGRYELPRLDTRDLPPYTAGEPAPAVTEASEEA